MKWLILSHTNQAQFSIYLFKNIFNIILPFISRIIEWFSSSNTVLISVSPVPDTRSGHLILSYFIKPTRPIFGHKLCACLRSPDLIPSLYFEIICPNQMSYYSSFPTRIEIFQILNVLNRKTSQTSIVDYCLYHLSLFCLCLLVGDRTHCLGTG